MKKAGRKIVGTMLAVVLVFAFAISAFAAGFTRQQATNAAIKDAGLTKAQVTRLQSEYDDGKYEVEFVRKSNNAKYEYEFSARNGKLLDKKVEYKHKRNTSKKKITKAAAINKVVKLSKIAKKYVNSGSCRYTRDDGEYIYEIKFKKGNYRYEYEVLAPTGQVIELSKEAIR